MKKERLSLFSFYVVVFGLILAVGKPLGLGGYIRD